MDLKFPQSFPILETKHLSLRTIHDIDAPTIFGLYSHPAVMLHRGEPIFKELHQAEKIIFHWRKLFAEERGLRWGIIFKSSDKLIGSAGFKKIEKQHLRADLGYELTQEFWNKGLMTEAVKAITDYGFSEMKLQSIEANISPEHTASKRVLEKIGFKHEAHYHENYFYEKWWDSAIYSLKK